MKKIILATVLAGLSSTAALAADLGARTPYNKAPAMVAVSNWSGFYIGGNVGYGWGNGGTDFSPLPGPVGLLIGFTPVTLDFKSKGVLGGGQIGYNWQMGSLVTGLEADIQGSGIKGANTQALTGNLNITGDLITSSEKLSWFGTVRGRFGVTISPDLLLYATGGLAYGQVDNSANVHFATTSAVDYPASANQTKVGWTAGAGAEWMFARNWSAKIEYLYLDLGNVSAVANRLPVPI